MRAKLSGKKWMFLEVLSKIVVENSIERIELKNLFLYKENNVNSTIWFPHHVSELDLCAHVVVKYEPTEDPKHPGFGDKKYIERRSELNKIANSYRFGEPIPLIEYTEEENNTWKIAYKQLCELRETHTCIEYQRNIAEMERIGLINADRIPQIRELSAYIQKKTGFELRPCGGLLSARDFLASLAFRIFQDENLAQISQDIGLLSLGANDKQIEQLATVYWFIIEFGLCKQNGRICAIGAGLLSAYGELKYACSNEPEHEPFNPEITSLRPYVDSDYQPVYFVAESIKKALEDILCLFNMP
uniref:Biopterin-dependent aromatic amino acid hydroxylase family profile domain-containing protein n=2 Tax=Meloidogyne incognita TaxID=6306 RepID=A0A914L3U5_MELIC